LRLFGQLLLVALVIGTSVSAAATERVTVRLVLTSTLAWAVVPVIQLLTGMWLVRAVVPSQRVRALETYFDTHWAWSLWILAVHALLLVWPASRGCALWLVPTGMVPAVFTIRALRSVCRTVVGMPAPAARRTVAVHQAATYAIVAIYASWASAYLPRLVGVLS
jgi:hypothetical protein